MEPMIKKLKTVMICVSISKIYYTIQLSFQSKGLEDNLKNVNVAIRKFQMN